MSDDVLIRFLKVLPGSSAGLKKNMSELKDLLINRAGADDVENAKQAVLRISNQVLNVTKLAHGYAPNEVKVSLNRLIVILGSINLRVNAIQKTALDSKHTEEYLANYASDRKKLEDIVKLLVG